MGMKQEISLFRNESLNNMAISMMESDLLRLKNDYTRAVVNSYKNTKGVYRTDVFIIC